MTSILFLKEEISWNIFRRIYLKNEKEFPFFLFCFLHFLNLDWIMNNLKKKMALIAHVFWNLRTKKAWLDKCLKNPDSEDPSTSNMVNGRNTVEIWTTAPSAYLLIPVKTITVEKVSVSDMQNLSTVC